MRKRELEKLLYQAVADAIGVEAEKGKGTQRSADAHDNDDHHHHKAAA